MDSIHLQDLTLVGLVSVGYSLRLARFAKDIGKLRGKYKIHPPEMSGPPEFTRAVRAQANCIEWAPSFFAALWGAGIFFHQVPAAIVGALYIYQRQRYFYEYTDDAEKRMKPFGRSVRCYILLLAMNAGGLATLLLRQYAGVDLKAIIVTPILSLVYPNTSV